MTTITIAIWIVVLLILPVLILVRIMETPTEKVSRLRRAGWSQQRIADRLGLSRSKVRRLLAA